MHKARAFIFVCVGIFLLIVQPLASAQLPSPVAGFTRALPYYVLMLQDGSAYIKLAFPTSAEPDPQWRYIAPTTFPGNKVVGIVAQSTAWGGTETMLVATETGYICGYTICCSPNFTNGVATCYGSIFDITGRAPDVVVDVTLAPQSQPATNTAFACTARGDVYQIVPSVEFLGNVAGIDPTPALRQTIGQLKVIYR